jgi:hypothetical protein
LVSTDRSIGFDPPAFWSREEVLAASSAVLMMAPGAVQETEDIFRLSALGLDWDIGVRVYEPQPVIATGADRKKIGIFLLHGGAGDYKSMEKFALLFAERFACKVVTMTFPGRLYLDDANRDWPGDTIAPDGSVRTPIWQHGEHVTRDAPAVASTCRAERRCIETALQGMRVRRIIRQNRQGGRRGQAH